MAKDLRAELKVDVEKAKRKVRGALEEASATGGSSVSGGVGGAADSAARSLRNLGDAARETHVNMKSVTKAFAGMGIGLAGSYAANYMKPGSGRDAVEYGSATVTGASMGAIAGPWGAAIGGLVGVLKTYIDKNSKIEHAIEDFVKSDDAYEENRLWQKKLRDLNEIEPAAVGLSGKDANADQTKKVDERLAKVKQEAVRLFEEQNKLIEKAKAHLKNGEEEEAKAVQEQLATVRMRKEQMESLERSYEKQKKSLAREAEELALKSGEFRGSTSATDALQKIGGMAAQAEAEKAVAESSPARSSGVGFAFSVPSSPSTTMRFGDPVGGFSGAMKTANEQLEKQSNETNRLLKAIDEHIQGKDTVATWQ